MMLNRREFLAGTASLLVAPRVLYARADTERRFVFIIQRGAADGLHTVIPYADPAYARLRGALALDPSNAMKLDGTFALHSALPELARLYKEGQASFFHAVASPYRDRSHFDGQNVLETGGSAPYQLKDGWLNRLLGILPQGDKQAIAFAPMVPMALRGAVEVSSYSPSNLPRAGDDLLLRVERLYSADAQLHALWSAAVEAQKKAGDTPRGEGGRQDTEALGRMAAGFLSRADGPRIAMIETGGWDTHSAQGERLELQFQGLDRLLAGLHQGLGDAWAHTVILVSTEFGRTVAVNGTGGTDHGTAGVAMLLGGAVQGGRVISDWPGLASGSLLEGRDLRPTLALDSLTTYAVAETFRLDPERTARVLFPNSKWEASVPTLLRT